MLRLLLVQSLISRLSQEESLTLTLDCFASGAFNTNTNIWKGASGIPKYK